jgi:tetratricopeptide (TPR) repeat protein
MPDPEQAVASDPADRLRGFCAAVLDLLGPESPPSISPAVCDALARALGAGVRGLADELRRELRLWDETQRRLTLLAESPFLGPEPLASALGAELERKRRLVSGVLAALEDLHDGQGRDPEGPPPASTSETASHVAVTDTATLPAARAPAPEDARHCYTRAEEHRRAREFDRALALYAQALRLDPQCRPAYVGRSLILLSQGRAGEAVADLDAALALGPEHAEAFGLRGDARVLAEDLDGADADYARALEINPGLVRVRFNRAVVCRLRGDLARALVELDRVLRERPDHAGAYHNRGLIHLREGRPADAVADFRAALRQDPNLTEAREQLQEALAALQPPAPPPQPALPPRSAPPPTPKVAEPAPAKPEAEPRPAQRSGLGAGRLTVNCPGCAAPGAINWDRLNKVMACPSCRGHFAVRQDGTAVPVVRAAGGRWVESAKLAAGRKQARTRRRLLVGVAAAAVLLLAAGLSAWWVVHPAAPREPELPRELTPRAELFARAWLRNDVPLMRRLTTPAADKAVYGWYTRHRPPALPEPPAGQDLPEGVNVEVSTVSSKEHLSVVRARFTGLPPTRGKPSPELTLSWEERGDSWYFVPPPK